MNNYTQNKLKTTRLPNWVQATFRKGFNLKIIYK